jgi:hypothetical protein
LRGGAFFNALNRAVVEKITAIINHRRASHNGGGEQTRAKNLPATFDRLLKSFIFCFLKKSHH